MNKKGRLSSAFNMSFGFIPVIISISLCEIMTQDIAIYIGTGIGILSICLSYARKKTQLPNFILYISTAMLSLLSVATLVPGEFVPPGALPITLEVSILIPMLILFMHKKKFVNHFLEKISTNSQQQFTKGIEASIVSARIVLILGVLHFLAISISIIIQGTLDTSYTFVFYQILPPVVFAFSIILNQICIFFFNHIQSHTVYLPIVNIRGDVIGNIPEMEAANFKDKYIFPVIRIAVSTHGMLFLCNRPSTYIVDKNKIDIPMECYLKYGETLTEAAARLINQTFPHHHELSPQFNVVYHFQNEDVNRLIYLFLIDMKDDSLLSSCRFKNSKLWSFHQIEDNLGTGIFSSFFEEEYEHLKNVIYTREIYKES